MNAVDTHAMNNALQSAGMFKETLERVKAERDALKFESQTRVDALKMVQVMCRKGKTLDQIADFVAPFVDDPASRGETPLFGAE